jgi:hypothetical protein
MLALLVVTVAAAAVTTSKVRHIDVNKAGAKKIRITGDWLAAGRRGIWLSGMEEIYRLNPRTGRRQARIPVPEGPCQASDVGAGAVWTATCGVPGLTKIDPSATASRATSRFPCRPTTSARAASAWARGRSGS